MALEHVDEEARSSTDVTAVEAAEILGLSPATVRRHTDSGLIPSWKTPGGHRRYRLVDLEAFKASA